MPNKNEIVWLAGFFDGEGSTCIRQCSKTSHAFELQITNTNQAIINKILSWYPTGTVFKQVRSTRWKPVHTFRASRLTAKSLLQDIIPYLQIKTEQCKLALEFINTFGTYTANGAKSTKWLETANYVKYPDGRLIRVVNNNLVAQRVNMRNRMLFLNKRGVQRPNEKAPQDVPGGLAAVTSS